MSGSYEAFISYRRGDASALAQWIRNRLQRYRLPDDVLKSLSKEMQELHQRRPRIYFDREYEKPNDDFLHQKIFPALDGSKRLIVVSSPSAFRSIRGANGADNPNWLVQEIEHFLGQQGLVHHRPIDVVLGALAPEDRFPGPLGDKPRWDWIDLRAFNWWRSWGLSEALDAGFTKLAAGVYDIPDQALPLMRREERRRRRRTGIVIGSVLLLLVGLAAAWWNARSAEQIAEAEHRFDVALRLVDTGSIPRAVDAFARLSEDGLDRKTEATRLLRWWSARLATASKQLAKLPDNSVFRWRGRNYVKAGGQLAGSYDGAPAFVSAITSDGARLVTFDSDRVLRVRTLAALDKPVLETRPLQATPGSIAELFGGRLLLFEGKVLSLQSDEDAENAQAVGGKVVVLLSAADKSYATADDVRDEAPGPTIDCSAVSMSGSIQRFEADSRPKEQADRGVLNVSAATGKPIEWRLVPTDDLPTTQLTPSPSAAPACQPYVIAPSPRKPTTPEIPRLAFPELMEERLLWKEVGAVASPATLSVCHLENDGSEAAEGCYAGELAVSIDGRHANDLFAILRDSSAMIDALQGLPERLFLRAAVGNQWVADAICEVHDERKLGQCLVLYQTAVSAAKFLANNEFFVINSPEVQSESFQLADAHDLRMFSVTPSPGEDLADVAMSPTGSRMAALTRGGEVWLYDINRAKATAELTRRYDLRTTTSAPVRDKSDTDSHDWRRVQRDSESFNSVAFIDETRLAVTGANGGTILAQVPSGAIDWARPPIALLGSTRQQVVSSVAADLLAVHDETSVQLLSLTSGALLSQVIGLNAFATSHAKNGEPSATTFVAIADDGRVQISYGGHLYRPSDTGADASTAWSIVPQLTGIAKNGDQGPLNIFLPHEQEPDKSHVQARP